MKAWTKSNCKNQWLHRFHIMMELPEGVLEMCEICKQRVFFPVRSGRPDNINYIAYHNRQSLPPWHVKFSREFPNSKYAKQNN